MYETKDGPVVRVVQEMGHPAPPHHPIKEPPAGMMRAAGLGGLGPVQEGGPGAMPTPDWGGPGGLGTSSLVMQGREEGREYEMPGPGGPPWTRPDLAALTLAAWLRLRNDRSVSPRFSG